MRPQEDDQQRRPFAAPLERARILEGLGFLGIQLQFTQGTNFASTWKFLA